MPPALKLITDHTSEAAPVAEFAEAMSALASGVVLVTCWLDGRPWGLTVTAFASVSADPPTVLVSLGSETPSVRAITASGRFGVSILAAEQLPVARFASVPGVAKFLESFTDSGRSTSPAVAGALAHLDCELSEAIRVPDHTVLFGHVRAVQASVAGAPLVYYRRAYRTVDAGPTERNARCLSS